MGTRLAEHSPWVAIYGAGRGGDAAAEILRQQSCQACFIDDDPAKIYSKAGIFSWEEFLQRWTDETGVFCAVADRAARLRIRDKVTSAGRRMITLIADAQVCPSAVVGAGCYIEAGAVIGPFVELGECVQIGQGAVVCHHTEIGAGVHVAPGAVIGSSCRIDALAYVGTGAVVESFTEIGDEAFVAAGVHVDRCIEPLEHVGRNGIRGRQKPSGYLPPADDAGFVAGADPNDGRG